MRQFTQAMANLSAMMWQERYRELVRQHEERLKTKEDKRSN